MMPLPFILYILILNTIILPSVNDTATLIVQVTNIPNNNGKVILSIYASKEDYLKKNYRFLMKPAKEGMLEFKLEDLPMQTYALMAHHDENDNGDTDPYFFGLPREYYGFSNDARSVFGPPSFESSKITLNKKHMVISFKVQ